MYSNLMFWLCAAAMLAALIMVGADWFLLHKRAMTIPLPGIVNRVFMFFCLAMLASNAIMVGSGNYIGSLYLSVVIILTEALFMVTTRVKHE